MEQPIQVLVFLLSFTISAAHFIPPKSHEKTEEIISSDVKTKCLNWFSILLQNPLFLFSIFTLISTCTLIYIRAKYFPTEEKDVNEPDRPKSKHLCYQSNVLIQDRRKSFPIDRPKKRFCYSFHKVNEPTLNKMVHQ